MAKHNNNIPSISEESILDRIIIIAKSDPLSFGAVLVVLIGFSIYEPMHALSTFAGVGWIAVFFWMYNRFFKSQSPPSNINNNKDKAKSSSSSSSSSSDIKQKVKNIWEAGKSSKNGNGSDKKTYSDKPFGSKYYYAHNNPGAGGGYKDGLKMEDYRMNGPRLLSKGGAPITEEDNDSENNNNPGAGNDAGEDNASIPAPSSSASSVKITAIDPNVLPITRYQWDDPGDYNGIATIRIDTLPTKGDEYIDWKEIDVQNVQANLVGEGLLVKIETADRGAYQLKIAKLYGDANAVKTVVKPKRLLVKITKKKIAALSGGGNKDKTNNLDAWPQPYRRI